MEKQIEGTAGIGADFEIKFFRLPLVFVTTFAFLFSKYLARVERDRQFVLKLPVGIALLYAILIPTDLKHDIACAARSKLKCHLNWTF